MCAEGAGQKGPSWMEKDDGGEKKRRAVEDIAD